MHSIFLKLQIHLYHYLDWLQLYCSVSKKTTFIMRTLEGKNQSLLVRDSVPTSFRRTPFKIERRILKKKNVKKKIRQNTRNYALLSKYVNTLSRFFHLFWILSFFLLNYNLFVLNDKHGHEIIFWPYMDRFECKLSLHTKSPFMDTKVSFLMGPKLKLSSFGFWVDRQAIMEHRRLHIDGK